MGPREGRRVHGRLGEGGNLKKTSEKCCLSLAVCRFCDYFNEARTVFGHTRPGHWHAGVHGTEKKQTARRCQCNLKNTGTRRTSNLKPQDFGMLNNRRCPLSTVARSVRSIAEKENSEATQIVRQKEARRRVDRIETAAGTDSNMLVDSARAAEARVPQGAGVADGRRTAASAALYSDSGPSRRHRQVPIKSSSTLRQLSTTPVGT